MTQWHQVMKKKKIPDTSFKNQMLLLEYNNLINIYYILIMGQVWVEQRPKPDIVHTLWNSYGMKDTN